MLNSDTTLGAPDGRKPGRRRLPQPGPLVAMFTAVALLHLAGWGLLFAGAAGAAGITIGIGVTAYVLGARHAFDADHIAAIDITTRKLAADTPGRRPVTVGFWFAAGHSTVVFLMALLLAAGVKSAADAVTDNNSTLHTVTSTLGPAVSGMFLYVLAAINLLLLWHIVKLFTRWRRGENIDEELDGRLASRGGLAAVVRKIGRRIRRPANMYPVGFLFGLGFDTATEVSLLVLAAGAAATLPWWAVLPLPLLFAAGMTLFDSVDGAFMGAAYDWADGAPLRKIYYNGVVTWLSVAVALGVGTVQLATVVAGLSGDTSGVAAAVANVGMDSVGFAVVGLFAATWLAAVMVWKVFRLDSRATPTV